MKLTKISIIMMAIVFFLTGCDSSSKKAQVVSSAVVDNKEIMAADTYTLTTTTGEKITFEVSDGVLFSKQLNGKTVLLNFWATWCQPCLVEMPTFVELQEKYKENFTIIGVLFEKEKDKDDLLAFMKKYNMNFPVTVGEENFVLAKALENVQMIPESFLYNKAGFFLEKFVGEVNKSKLENYIKEDMDS